MFSITWRAARVNRSLTLDEVAELTGEPKDVIKGYEEDPSDMPCGLIIQLRHLYGIPVDLMYFGHESDLKYEMN